MPVRFLQHIRAWLGDRKRVVAPIRAAHRPRLEALEAREQPALILGSAFLAEGAAAAQQPTDLVLSGIVVNLSGQTSGGTAVQQQATTDTSGVFRFDNLLAGTYQISSSSAMIASGSNPTYNVADSTTIDHGLGFLGIAPGGYSLRMFLNTSTAADAPASVATGGSSQSPININTASVIASDLVDLVFNYTPLVNQVFFQSGTKLEVELDEAAQASNFVIDSDGTIFYLKQFHFHTTSEHTIDGQSFGGELHMVHADANGNTLVIGILLESNAGATPSNAYLTLLANLPPMGGETHVSLDPNQLLPATTRFYAYTGSLTTPPFSEGLRWRVMTQTVQLTPSQLLSITNTIGGFNNRAVQPLNGRTVLIDVS